LCHLFSLPEQFLVVHFGDILISGFNQLSGFFDA